MNDKPNAVLNESNKVIGWATHWNPVGLGECIVQYNDGSADSAIFSELKFANPHAARLYLDSKEP